MSTISKTFTFAAGNRILAAEHNTNFDTIYNDYNGSISNANISASAAIGASKLNLTSISQNIVNITTSGTNLNLDNDGTGHGLHITQDGVLASGKNGILIDSTVAQVNANSAVVKVVQNHAGSTEPAIEVVNDGGNACIEANATANSATHFRLTGDPSNLTPTDGDVWFTGSTLNAAFGSDVHGLSGTSSIGFFIDGGTNAITTGIKGDVEVPFQCIITQATMLLDQSSTTTVDVWLSDYSDFPPVDGGSIMASAPLSASSANKAQDTTLTGWTTNITAGQIFRYNVDANDNATRCMIAFKVRKI